MDQDKDRGPLGHTISHTDTAQGKGGGQMTQEPANDPDDTSPTNRQTANDDNSKDSTFRSPGKPEGGQDADDVADRMGSTGRESGIGGSR